MRDLDALLLRARAISARLLEAIDGGKNILVLGHLDADGQVASALISREIERRGGRFVLRVVSEMDDELLEELAREDYDFYVICDLGAGVSDKLRDRLGDRFVVIDHHQIPEREVGDPYILNPWCFGYDGGRDACSSTMAYYLTKEMDGRATGLAWEAVVGALADRQDEEGRALASLNRMVVEDAVKEGSLRVGRGLLLPGMASRPIHKSLSLLMDPYLPGLSGDEGSCLSFLNSIGLKLKEGERWRTLSELSEGEEKLLLNSLTPYVRGDLSRLIGEVYELVREEEGSPLRDAREFSTLLNACGRMGRQDLSFSVLFGDRSERLREAEQVMLEYRMKLASYMEEVLRGDRVRDLGPFRFVDGSGLVEWDMLGPLASMLGSVREFEGKPVVASSSPKGGYVKLSARATRGSGPVNLGSIMKKVAEGLGGWGGGHKEAAGAKVREEELERFIEMLRAEF